MKKRLIIMGCIILSIFLFAGINQEKSLEEGDFNVTDYVNISGVSSVIEQEEYDFFYEVVSKDFVDRSTQEDIQQETIQFIQDVHAQFLIGNHLGVNKPYSYQALIYEMEQENLSRKLKKQNNEVFYGPLQYELSEYFKYTLNNTKINIVKKLGQNANEKLVKKAEEFYESQPDRFQTIIKINYEITQNGETEQRTLLNHEMSTMEKVESELFQELYNGEEGSVFEFEENGEKAMGKVLSKEMSTAAFQDVQQEVLKVYITQYIYDHLVSVVGEDNPIKLAND